MKTVIYMVRHAESPYTEGTERTRGLSRKGQEDAERITEVLHPEGIDMIISSPYARAILSVEGLAKKIGLEVDIYEDLRERHFAGAKPKHSDENFMKVIMNRFHEPDFALPGGESNKECQNRSIAVLKNVLENHKGKKIALGTHGNVMTMMINYFDSNYGLAFLKQTSKPDIYRLAFEGFELKEVLRLWEE